LLLRKFGVSLGALIGSWVVVYDGADAVEVGMVMFSCSVLKLEDLVVGAVSRCVKVATLRGTRRRAAMMTRIEQNESGQSKQKSMKQTADVFVKPHDICAWSASGSGLSLPIPMGGDCFSGQSFLHSSHNLSNTAIMPCMPPVTENDCVRLSLENLPFTRNGTVKRVCIMLKYVHQDAMRLPYLGASAFLNSECSLVHR